MNESPKKLKSKSLAITQMAVFSAIGIVMFFVPFDWRGKETIAFDHLASFLVSDLKPLAVGLLFLMMIYGVIRPFVRINGMNDWHKNTTNKILSLFKIIGLILAVMYITNTAPDAIMTKDMLPFLFDKLALNVGMIVPIGALILAFLLGFGLLELVGVLMQPVMRPLFKTPGESAIDAVASFVGSYSVALLITNRVYLSGQYSAKEAIIIATGFSTVSTAFMVIIAKTLDLMAYWSLYFWSCLIITFVITAITVHLPPIRGMDNTSQAKTANLNGRSRLSLAIDKGVNVAKHSDPVAKVLWDNFKDGINMAAAIVPSIIAIGLLGLLLEKYTPIFDVLGLLLAPFTFLGGMSEPLVAAKGISTGLAEMFLPALVLKDSDILTRFVTAIVSVSSIIFFSAMIPCVLATKLPVTVGKMVVIWLIRTALGIVLACLVGHLAMTMGWLA
ncbi:MULTISPECIES: YjiH family protein [unclassified Moraxella]|uniref:YjiH family protein n=1 Tax=unclassified Moraxella TaxID=2685852 RepID=UPI00359DBA82